MKLWSDGWTNGDTLPQRYALGRIDGAGQLVFGDNISPHLCWSAPPAGTLSLALIGQDFDAPAWPADAPRPSDRWRADVPRSDFFHWLLIDLPPTLRELPEGLFSQGFSARGKPQAAPLAGARQGLNDLTQRFADDAALAGAYHGYDGPYPPPEDPLVHHYAFTLFALAVPRLALPAGFTGHQLRQALPGQVLADATLSGTYCLNPQLWPDWHDAGQRGESVRPADGARPPWGGPA